MTWTVVTAGTKSYRPWIERTRDACERFGYEFICFDLGGLGIGRPYEVEPIKPGGPRSPFKPQLIAEAANSARSDSSICWIDGDAVLLKPLPNENYWHMAVAIHERDAKDEKRGYAEPFSVNAGWVCFADAGYASDFCVSWARQVQISKSDQDALNLMICNGDCLWWTNNGKDWRIGIYPARIYNNRWKTEPDTVIRHYEGPKTRDLEAMDEWMKNGPDLYWRMKRMQIVYLIALGD